MNRKGVERGRARGGTGVTWCLLARRWKNEKKLTVSQDAYSADEHQCARGRGSERIHTGPRWVGPAAASPDHHNIIV